MSTTPGEGHTSSAPSVSHCGLQVEPATHAQAPISSVTNASYPAGFMFVKHSEQSSNVGSSAQPGGGPDDELICMLEDELDVAIIPVLVVPVPVVLGTPPE